MSQPIRLKRSLGLLEATMIGMGATIGPTIFVVPSTAFRLAGPASVISFILAGLVTLVTALNYAAMSSAVPEAGGGYSFASRAFGGFLAFISGWSLWIGNIAYASLSAYTFAVALSYLLPFVPLPLLAIATILAFSAINFIGAKQAGMTQVVLTLSVLAILVGFVLVGLSRANNSFYDPFFPKGIFPVLTSVGYVYSIYIGFENIANASEEIKRSEILVPRAILLTMLISLVLFPLVMATLVGILPGEVIVGSESPMLQASNFLFGQAGGTMIIFAILAASLASLNAAILSSARIAYSLGRDKHIPSFFTRIQRRLRTPYFAIGLSMMISIAMILSLNVDFLVYMTSFGYLLGLVVINVSAIQLKRKGILKNSSFRASYPLVPILAVASTLVAITFLDPNSLAIGSGFALVGTLLTFAYRRATHGKK